MAIENLSAIFSLSKLNKSFFSNSFGEDFILCDNGNVAFHWADFHETFDFVKSKLQNDPNLMQDLKKSKGALSELAKIPIWIKTKKKIFQSDMYTIYEKYILTPSELPGNLDPFCPHEISFISGAGPFKSLSISDCFNEATYRDFILMLLFENKLPLRNFRLHLKSKVLMESGQDFTRAELVSVEQFSTDGILFSIDSSTYVRNVKNSSDVRFLLNFQTLADVKGKDRNEMKNTFSRYSFNFLYSSSKDDAIVCKVSDFSLQSSFNFNKDKKVYLFIPYKNLHFSNAKNSHVIQDFVHQLKEIVRQHYSLNDLLAKIA